MSERSRPRRRSFTARLPRFGEFLDVTEETIAFVEKYQQVWEAESKAMLSLGQFLGARSDSLRAQVELMRMGSGAFRRYNEWVEAMLSLRPDRILQSLMSDVTRNRADEAEEESDAGHSET